MEMEITQKIMGKGSGSSGHLLNTTLADEPQFIPINFGFIIKEIGISSMFILALSKEGQIYMWGFLNQLQVERPLKLMQNVQKISCGWEHALFTVNNRLYGLGNNSYNQLGVETATSWQKQAILVSQKNAIFIKAGFRQSYAVFQKELYGCGESKKYELASLSKTASLWKQIASISNIGGQIISVLCGKRFLILLDSFNKVYAIGTNENNCFNCQNGFFTQPAIIFENVKQMACGWSHIILLKQDGEVESYGKNNLGQLGHHKETAKIEFNLFENERIDHIQSGTQFSFAISNQGRLFGWGWNQHQNITHLQSQIIRTPTEIKLEAKCLKLWTHSATTFIQISEQYCSK